MATTVYTNRGQEPTVSLSFNPNSGSLPLVVVTGFLNHAHFVLAKWKPNHYGSEQLTTSLKPSPQWRRFRPDIVLSMLCWYWDSSSSFIFLSSSPALSSVLWLWFIQINKDIKLHEVIFSKFITIYMRKFNFSHLKPLDWVLLHTNHQIYKQSYQVRKQIRFDTKMGW